MEENLKMSYEKIFGPNTYLKVNEISDINVITNTNGLVFSLETAIQSLGVTPTITYEMADNLPSSPNISNLTNFSEIHVYIHNDIPYLYTNLGSGNSWLSIAEAFSLLGTPSTDKGYVEDPQLATEPGVYVVYKKGSFGIVKEKNYSIQTYENGEWVELEDLYWHIINDDKFDFYDPRITYLTSTSITQGINCVSVNLPNLVMSNTYLFDNCRELKTVSLPKLTILYWLRYCDVLEKVYIPNVIVISSCFISCYNLKTIIIEQTESVCECDTKFIDCYHFFGTVNEDYNPNGDKDGYVYVPDSLVEDYKTAPGWSTIASQIRPLSEYTE